MREWLEDPEVPWWAKLRRAQVHISEVRQRAWNRRYHGDEACATNSMSRAERADLGRRDRHLDRQDAHSCRCARVPSAHPYAGVSTSIRGQQCGEGHVAESWYLPSGWARSPTMHGSLAANVRTAMCADEPLLCD